MKEGEKIATQQFEHKSMQRKTGKPKGFLSFLKIKFITGIIRIISVINFAYKSILIPGSGKSWKTMLKNCSYSGHNSVEKANVRTYAARKFYPPVSTSVHTVISTIFLLFTPQSIEKRRFYKHPVEKPCQPAPNILYNRDIKQEWIVYTTVEFLAKSVYISSLKAIENTI